MMTGEVTLDFNNEEKRGSECKRRDDSLDRSAARLYLSQIGGEGLLVRIWTFAKGKVLRWAGEDSGLFYFAVNPPD